MQPATDWLLRKVDAEGRVWYLRILPGKRRRDRYDWAHCPVFATVFPVTEAVDPLIVRVRAATVRPKQKGTYRPITPALALHEWAEANDRRAAQAAAGPLEPPAAGSTFEVG